MFKEIWKPVCNKYRDYYEVSNLGEVRRSVGGRGTTKGKILKASNNEFGYLVVTLSKLGVLSTFFVHVLVANAFLGPCPKGKEVNHKDLNKTNNKQSNLEYLTRFWNMQHAIDNGVRFGELSHAKYKVS